MRHPIKVGNSSTPGISVIVPVIDEAALLEQCLVSVGSNIGNVEVMVVDGGSRDDSIAVAARAGARVVHSSVRQRAAQMNLGAREARDSILLFLHADTQLPMGWQRQVRDAFRESSGCVGGAFRRRFDLNSRFLGLTCRLADLRGRRFGWFLGDQAMFVHRDVFERLGGFGPLRLFEDLDFSRRLARTGPTVLLDGVVLSSGRRFLRHGPLRQTVADLVLTWRYFQRPEAFVERPEPMTDEDVAGGGGGAAALLPRDRVEHRRSRSAGCRRTEETCRREPR